LKTTAIIVNYKVSALTLKAVESVLASDSIGRVHIAVVDNSEDKDEAETLRLNLPSAVSLWISPKNIGFGRACNLCFDKFKGELVLLLNPDARLLPGCLLRLQKTLISAENVGAVSPQIFFDKGLRFFLPPCCGLSSFIYKPILDSWSPRANINRLQNVLWRRHSIKVWRADKPIKVSNLPGGLVLLKRAAVRKAGGLFDPRFFLYFEDTDLFVRLRKAGYSLIIDPRAEAIHYYDQCGQDNWQEKRALMARSHRIFLKKHCKGWKLSVKKILDHFKAPSQPDRNQLRTPDFTTYFVMEVPERLHKDWLFEWSPNPDFVPAAGRFGKGPRMDFTEECWAMLAPGQYFGRLGSPMESGRCSQMVSWIVEDTS
jgi:GT2 family glycosyltransferase